MSLASRVGLLSTRVSNYLRDSVLPRLLPAGGSAGQVLTKSSATNYAVGWTTPAAGGGSSTKGTATFTITPAANSYATVSIDDTTVTATSVVLPTMAPSPDWDADELGEFGLLAEPTAGSFLLHISYPGPFGGTFNLNYLVAP